MEERLKILPAVVLCAGLLFILKAVDLWTGFSSGTFGTTQAVAASQAHAGAPKEEHDAAPAHEEHAPPGAPAPPVSPDVKTTLEAEGFAVEEDDPQPDFGVKKRRSGSSGSLDDGLMSKSEVDVLESLAARRADLDKRAADLDMRAALLAATEQRVNERVEELKALEAQIAALLVQKKEIEAQKIASLVKIYESMKPKDAARIFETLDKDVLISVASGMKEAKIADVMAEMSPEAAQALTVQLADHSRQSSDNGT